VKAIKPARVAELDAADPLAHKRAAFELPAGVVYLDGNSLGALPKGVAARLHKATIEEWGQGLIRSWNDAHWYPAPQRVGAQIARLIGAKAHEVIACDSTSVNLYKVLWAACQGSGNLIITEADNFPTDVYLCQSIAANLGKTLRAVPGAEIAKAVRTAGADLACLMLTQVHYKTGQLHDMAALTQLAQAHGGRVVWDLAHSAGIMPLQVHALNVDYAVGCTYKYLNGGPGAPAYVYVHERHILDLQQPLYGWHGHAAPFAFSEHYQAHAGIEKMLVGTASQLSLLALEEALKVYDDVDLTQVRNKSLSLTQLFIDLLDQALPEFTLITPREPALRGSQVALSYPDPKQGYAIMQALIEHGVIGDFRAPNILRFGFAPLYLSHQDVVQAVAIFTTIMREEIYRAPRFQAQKAVT
jgi:kynureninase